MKKNITLSINSPCHENWDSFTPAEGGAFCATCTKVVRDFTAMSDQEMIEYLRVNKNVCGRFKQSQLKTYGIPLPAIAPSFKFFRGGLFGTLLLLGVGSITHAQVKPATEIVASSDSEQMAKSFNVRGRVVSADDQSPLPGVNVIVKNTTWGAVTDADGRFSIAQKLKPGQILVFSFIGLETIEYVIPNDYKEGDDFQMVTMAMEPCDVVLMGTVAYETPYVDRPGFFSRLWNGVKSIF